MPKLTHLLITRERESIFIPLPRELWSSAGKCSCPACHGQEGFVDTLAVAARQEEVPDTNYTWTVHYPHLHSAQEYDKARSAATLTPGSDGDAADAHQHVWDFDSGPVDEIREYSCKCGGEKQVIVETREDGTTTTIRIFEPAQGSDEDQDEDEAESEHENP